MSLTKTQQHLAALAAASARGDQDALARHLHAAFGADGLTVQQAQSALEQLYAYCGFPRSLNALTTLMNVVEERKKTGNPPTRRAAALPATRRRYGRARTHVA